MVFEPFIRKAGHSEAFAKCLLCCLQSLSPMSVPDIYIMQIQRRSEQRFVGFIYRDKWMKWRERRWWIWRSSRRRRPRRLRHSATADHPCPTTTNAIRAWSSAHSSSASLIAASHSACDSFALPSALDSRPAPIVIKGTPCPSHWTGSQQWMIRFHLLRDGDSAPIHSTASQPPSSTRSNGQPTCASASI